MHSSFILQQYVYYTTILNMFRAARCSSSEGQIVSPQPLVSSPSVNSRTVRRWRADCSCGMVKKKIHPENSSGSRERFHFALHLSYFRPNTLSRNIRISKNICSYLSAPVTSDIFGMKRGICIPSKKTFPDCELAVGVPRV